MSDVTKTAIYSAISGDSALAALLGKDELNSPAIFNATLNQKLQDKANPGNSWTFPCITFRQEPSSTDTRFRESTVDNEIFAFEIWVETTSALTIPLIGNHLDRILHNKTLLLGSGSNYDCVRITQAPDLFDDKLNLHFGLYRYRLVVSR
ncbi:hypothetical protein LLG39_12590 [bacterium]|nr:hypothetical protein [bacterium]